MTAKKMTKAAFKRFRKALNEWSHQEKNTPGIPFVNELTEMRMILWSLEENDMTGSSSTISDHVAEIVQSFSIPVSSRPDGGWDIN